MFLAAKMIYSSTLLLNTLDYSKAKNIRVTEPYLLYYSTLNCCRALIFMLPTQLWNNGEITSDNHNKIINVAADLIKRLNIRKGADLAYFLNIAKDYRELFSYKFPSEGVGDSLFKEINIDNVSFRCTMICEIAQFTSECFETSYNKNCIDKVFELDEDVLEKCFLYLGNETQIIDDDDTYRISYIAKKVNRPHNIYHTMTPGMTDDFFGSWLAKDEDDGDSFNPDIRKIKIFDLP